MSDGKVIKISPSSLNLYRDCPRCFWLQLNEGVRRPEPPSSTVPMGVDLTLKVYFDEWRKTTGVPPLLSGKLPGRLLKDEALIAKFRSRSFEWYDKEVGAYFTGILDDALELEEKYIVPLDNKTRGFPPKEPHAAHVVQMSAYTLILRENGFTTKNLAYLIYWFLNHKSFEMKAPLDFNVAIEEVRTDPDRVLSLFREAATSLRGELPPPSAECAFCMYRRLNK